MDFLDDVIDAQMMANSRQEALDLVGDGTFYTGADSVEDDGIDDFSYVGTESLSSYQEDMLRDAGIDPDDLKYMDDDEVREALEDAGLDVDDFTY